MGKQWRRLNTSTRGRGRPGIPPHLQDQTRERILRHAAVIVPEKASQLRVWFKGSFCYIDAQEADSAVSLHLCRLRYTGHPDRWSLAFYTYSHEMYEPSVFMSGEPFGTPEEGLDIGAIYLR